MGFKSRLGDDARALMEAVMFIAEKSSIMPITFHGTLEELEVDEKRLGEAVRYLIKQGRLIRIYKNRGGNREEFMTPEALNIIKKRSRSITDSFYKTRYVDYYSYKIPHGGGAI
ncbi:MAG: hypothetical protein ACPL2F_01380 [Dissulfurimicrobium hydrothermale]|uniref:hypothetical protein n=1 Tax=Dissulfurimicrobium hydrothermale TaxID=1750598 RepID=UPI003C75AA8F